MWTDFVNAEFDNGDNVARIPPLRFGVGVNWARAAWSAGANATRVTEPDDRAALETPTDAYTMVRLYAERDFNVSGAGTVRIFARVSNVANETARRHNSFVKDLAPLPGISGLFGIRATF